MQERFGGKVAIITGAASGIGRAIAERLAREGASVLIADLDEPLGREVETSLQGKDGRAAFLRVDVTREEECAAMVEAATSRWGRLDILVNSAGVGRGGPVAAMDEALWDQVLDVNLKGVYLCCRAAFPALAAAGGAVVNLSSAAALRAKAGMGAYAASKAGLIQFTRVLALEGAPHGLRANTLCPVWIDTPMVRNHLALASNPKAARREMERAVPLGRFGTVDDVAAAALFLLSDEAAFITGVALPVDGGASC